MATFFCESIGGRGQLNCMITRFHSTSHPGRIERWTYHYDPFAICNEPFHLDRYCLLHHSICHFFWTPRIGKGDIDFLVEPLDDFSRRVLGGAEASHQARLIALQEIAN